MIDTANIDSPVRGVVTAPTMELLTYAWRYVLGRAWFFIGFSGLLVMSMAATVFVVGIFLHIVGLHPGTAKGGPIDWLMSGLANIVGSAFVVIPIWAGIYGMVFAMLDGDPEPIKGFSVLQRKYLDVVCVSVIGALPALFAQYICWAFVPRSFGNVVGTGISLVIGAAVVLALPGVVRLNLGPIDALIYSVRRFASRPLPFIGYYIGAFVLALSGLLACGIGVLLTLSVLIVAPALLMLDPEPRTP